MSPNYEVLLLLSALPGLGLGGEYGVGQSLVAEILNPRHRGWWSGVFYGGAFFAIMLASLVAGYILPAMGWRWTFFLSGLPALFAFYLRDHTPESPAWRQAVHQERTDWRVFPASAAGRRGHSASRLYADLPRINLSVCRRRSVGVGVPRDEGPGHRHHRSRCHGRGSGSAEAVTQADLFLIPARRGSRRAGQQLERPRGGRNDGPVRLPVLQYRDARLDGNELKTQVGLHVPQPVEVRWKTQLVCSAPEGLCHPENNKFRAIEV